MKIITAINNERIYKELKNKNNIKVISNDIQYKEGILEILEKNKNINYIIFDENLNGQIIIEELIKKIKNINNKIKIIIILNKKDSIKEKYLNKNKIKFIFREELCLKKITEMIFNKNKIIGILGNRGTGKTITTLILSELITKHRNKKILIIEDNIKNDILFSIYKIKENNNESKIIKIKKNIDLLNIKKIFINNIINKVIDKTKIIYEINKIKNNYNYIFIDIQNINNYKIYKNIIDENILIIEPNLLEINKIKNFILKNKKELKIILNKYNENSISENLIKNIFNNKIKIIEKIENNKKYNLIINNNFNINYLDNKTKNKYLKIIKYII